MKAECRHQCSYSSSWQDHWSEPSTWENHWSVSSSQENHQSNLLSTNIAASEKKNSPFSSRHGPKSPSQPLQLHRHYVSLLKIPLFLHDHHHNRISSPVDWRNKCMHKKGSPIQQATPNFHALSNQEKQLEYWGEKVHPVQKKQLKQDG